MVPSSQPDNNRSPDNNATPPNSQDSFPPVPSILNRVLLALGTAVISVLLLLYLTEVAEAVIAAIALVVGALGFLFPTSKAFHESSIFQSRIVTAVLAFLLGLGTLSLLHWFFPLPSNDIPGGVIEVETIPVISSTFDNSPEDWEITGQGIGPFYESRGGDPGGYIVGEDNEGPNPADWYWSAPSRFLGDRSAFYGGILLFSLTQHNPTNQIERSDDLRLRGQDLTVTLDLANPNSGWTQYVVWLHEDGGWKKANGDSASQADIKRVLSALEGIDIRGEYRTGMDRGGLDTVIVMGRP